MPPEVCYLFLPRATLVMMKPEYWREGKGPAFVYVAGAEGTGRLFYKQAADLRRDHTVITFPLRATGPHTLRELIRDLRWIMRDAGFARATLLGESFGGMVLLAAALAHPKMFERMILLNAFPYFTQRAKIRLGVALYSLLPYSWMRAYRARDIKRTLFGPEVAEEERRFYSEQTRFVPRDGYLSRLRIIRDTDLRPRLPEIKVPALVVAGTADGLIDSAGAARLLVSALPRSRLKLLEGAGHTPLLSERVRVREWLAEFEQFATLKQETGTAG